jgi:uncharacterized protein (DUF2267 family)
MDLRTEDLVDLVSFRAAVPLYDADHALHAVVGTIGLHLDDAHRQLLTEELPRDLAVALTIGGDIGALDEELIASVCRVLAEELSHEAVHAVREEVPDPIARFFVPGAPAEPDFAAGHTLATGTTTQADSVAEANPHGARKLSSAHRAR